MFFSSSSCFFPLPFFLFPLGACAPGWGLLAENFTGFVASCWCAAGISVIRNVWPACGPESKCFVGKCVWGVWKWLGGNGWEWNEWKGNGVGSLKSGMLSRGRRLLRRRGLLKCLAVPSSSCCPPTREYLGMRPSCMLSVTTTPRVHQCEWMYASRAPGCLETEQRNKLLDVPAESCLQCYGPVSAPGFIVSSCRKGSVPFSLLPRPLTSQEL